MTTSPELPSSHHPSLAVGDRVIDLARPEELFTVRGYDGAKKILLLESDSGIPLICPAKWFELFYKGAKV